MHFGPNWDQLASSVFLSHNSSGFQTHYHKYEFIWDESGIKFLLDGVEFGHVPVVDGFWARGKFSGENIWKDATKMAPFDEEVTLLLIGKSKIQYMFSFNCSFILSLIWPSAETSSRT